jgi:hypothetical protein
MQANTTAKRFGRSWFGTGLVALGIVTAVGIGTLAQRDVELPAVVGGTERASVETSAFYSPGMGEGLLSSGISTTPAVKAYYAPSMGEGLIGNYHALPAAVEAHFALGQGEGLVGGAGSLAILSSPVNAYSSAGMGEGWIGLGRPADVPQAHYSEGMGEGWVGSGR